jgi:hypothetical protein
MEWRFALVAGIAGCLSGLDLLSIARNDHRIYPAVDQIKEDLTQRRDQKGRRTLQRGIICKHQKAGSTSLPPSLRHRLLNFARYRSCLSIISTHSHSALSYDIVCLISHTPVSLAFPLYTLSSREIPSFPLLCLFLSHICLKKGITSHEMKSS